MPMTFTEHVRNCAECKAGRECAEAVAIIGGYFMDELVQAIYRPNDADADNDVQRRREWNRQAWKRKCAKLKGMAAKA